MLHPSFVEPSTPPDKTIVLPPSPPATGDSPSAPVAAVLYLFHQHKRGSLESLWTRVRLQPLEYQELWDRLDEDKNLARYVGDKVG
ncbi:MAG: hypothetical protein M1840_001990 [Geoglossum simile]|nr:MAG: hypothetical protein M1840_001990 [Geoglossum simile]